MPLAAVAPLLRRLAAASEDRTFVGLLDSDAEVGGLDAIRIFESVHRQLTSFRPAALFVDDLQWVDPLSIALCHFLVRAAAGSGRGLALVVASRPSPIADRFAASLATALGEGAEPDDAAPASAGSRRWRPIRPEPERKNERSTRSGRALGASGRIAVLAGSAHPDRRRRARLRRGRRRADTGPFGGDANALLAMLAVLGRPIDRTELESIIGWPPERIVSASTELSGSEGS